MYFVQKNSTATVTEKLKVCPDSNILRSSITVCVNKNKQPDYY